MLERTWLWMAAASFTSACATTPAPSECPEPTVAPPATVVPAGLQPEASPPAPLALVVPLEGPFEDPAPIVEGRIDAAVEECGPYDDPKPRVEETARESGEGLLLEARVYRHVGEMACAPIQYCVVALKTERGWWLTPDGYNGWCDGVTGTGTSIETYESLEPSENQVWYRGEVVTHHLEYRDVGGQRQERRYESESFFALGCQVTQDHCAWCQSTP